MRTLVRDGRDPATAMPRRHTLMRALVWLNAIAICTVLAAAVIVPTGSRVVVIAAPWSDPSRILDIITGANGAIVASGATDWIMVAEGADPGFAGRVMAGGALMVLDGRLAEACIRIGDYL